MLARMAESLYHRFVGPRIEAWFFRDLIARTENFSHVTWLGQPVWQNVLDLWIMQETLAEVKPALLIETGTNRGGSALFFAHLFDLLGHGQIISIDVEKQSDITHPRIIFLIGNSVAPDIVAAVHAKALATVGPVMVTLDSDHREKHVRQELNCYAPLVTPGSYCLVQDGVIDTLPRFAAGRPGPLAAIEDFLGATSDFELDEERSRKFLISHHPKGWLRRKASPESLKK
jgi:cephalosporin hydroxylase